MSAYDLTSHDTITYIILRIYYSLKGPMQMPAIAIRDLVKSFPSALARRKRILHEISFDVQQGNVTGFIGLNGAGKSTLINLLMGFTFPDRGDISILGNSPLEPTTRKKIGYLPEHAHFLEHLTGWQLLKYVGAINDLPAKIIRNRGQNLLERLALAYAGTNQIRSYSKGMRQRLGLVLALLPDPELYILDEPMSGLDPLGRQMVKNIILEEKKRGKSIFFSTHILSDIQILCDDIKIIQRGRIVYSGAVDTFCASASELETKFIELHGVVKEVRL